MNIPGRPRPNEIRQAEERETAALDRYLDGLNDGAVPPASKDDLEASLAATARAVHGPAAGAAPELDRAAEDRLWRDLRRTQHRPAITALPPASRPIVTLPASSAPVSSGLGPRRGRSGGRPARRLQAFGSLLGVVATLCLVALVAMSAFSLYLNAPPLDSTPTVSLTGYAVTPTAASMVAGVSTPDLAATPGQMSFVPVDLVQPITQACTVTPRTMDDVISTLAEPFNDPMVDNRYVLPSPLIPVPESADNDPGVPLVEPLPQGSPVDRSIVDAIAILYGQRFGCSNVMDDRLGETALYSNDGLVRLYWRGGLGPDGYLVIGLGAETLPPSAEELELIGQPGQRWLWGFRMLPDGRVACYIAQGQYAAPNGYPQTFEEVVNGQLANGYMVFVRQGDQWLIDEERGPFQG